MDEYTRGSTRGEGKGSVFAAKGSAKHVAKAVSSPRRGCAKHKAKAVSEGGNTPSKRVYIGLWCPNQ